MSILLGVINEGLIYALMALGVYITYSILDFPDLSVDSTFPLGAAVTATLILAGVPPFLTLPLAFAAGALAGAVTGIIHVKLGIRDLLSGIIVMTGLYSINLAITGNKANLPIFSQDTIFENAWISGLPPALADYSTPLILLLIVLVVKLLLDLYLETRSGYLLRAAGDNETLVTSLAKDKGRVKLLGLALANGLTALSGAVYCQQKGFFDAGDVNMSNLHLAAAVDQRRALRNFRQAPEPRFFQGRCEFQGPAAVSRIQHHSLTGLYMFSQGGCHSTVRVRGGHHHNDLRVLNSLTDIRCNPINFRGTFQLVFQGDTLLFLEFRKLFCVYVIQADAMSQQRQMRGHTLSAAACSNDCKTHEIPPVCPSYLYKYV